MDEVDDEKMKELLKFYGVVEIDNRDESNVVVVGMLVLFVFLYRIYFCLEKWNFYICSVKLFYNWG